MGISALILSKNEAENIVDCIKSVSFADEIIVIDDFSTDDTVTIAQSLHAKVIQRNLNGDFGAQKNYAAQQASQDWLLFIDCDERVTTALADEIVEKTHSQQLYAYYIKRINHFRRKPVLHGTLSPDAVMRLVPRKGCAVEGVVHERVNSPFPEKYLKNKMLHYTYHSWAQIFNKTQYYAKLSAEKYAQQNKKISFFKDILLRPIWAFVRTYFFNLGFLDGKVGFVLSVNHYYYTLTKYVRYDDLKYSKD